LEKWTNEGYRWYNRRDQRYEAAMNIGFLVSSARAVRPTWTTAHLAQSALLDQHRVRFFEAGEIEVTPHGRLVARAHVLDAPCTSPETLSYRLSSGQLVQRYVEISGLDVLLLRANPFSPHVRVMALLAQERGVRVYNDPAGIIRTRTKTWLATLTDVPKPQTLITKEISSARIFAENLGTDIVLKPAIGSGGRGVVRIPRANPRRLSRAFFDLQHHFPGPVVVQAYSALADLGEKRLFWVDGQVVGAYLRTRAPGAFHHNLQRGATPDPCTVSEADARIVSAISPHLMRNGIRLAGLDVIGGELIEVNTLNPGGLHYAESFRSALDRDKSDPPLATRVIRHLTTAPNWDLSEASHA
jgi:glutathione synthase